MKKNKLKLSYRLIQLVKPLTHIMLFAIFLGLIGQLSATFISVLAAIALTTILTNTSYSILFCMILMLVLVMIRACFRYGEQACNHYIAFKLLAFIRQKVFTKLRELCPAKLEGKDKGDLISMITSDIELLEVFYAHTISPVCIAILYGICMLIWFSLFHVSYVWLSGLAYVCIGILVPLYISKKSQIIQNRKQIGELSSFVLESIRGLSQVLQFGQGNMFLQQMQKKSEKALDEEKILKKQIVTSQIITNTLIYIFDFLFIAIASLQEFNFMQIVIPVLSFMASFGPFIALANLGSTLQNTFESANRLFDLFDERAAIDEVTNEKEISFEQVQIQNISFSYQEQNILKDFSLDLKKGSMIGIFGKSGCGKSTLLKLLMRFYDVQQGCIQITDKNIKSISTKNLRNMESYMCQQTHLFKDTILNNIKIANLHATDLEVIEACQKAGIHDFIMNCKDGYQTQIEELGNSVSGGEKQRLGLARCFLQNGSFLLLDEPTSNLDSLNEAIILKSLDEQRNDKTIVLVSHRQSTLRLVDSIVAMEGKKT